MRSVLLQASRRYADLTIQLKGKGWVVKAVPLEERALEEEVFDSDPRFPASIPLNAESERGGKPTARLTREHGICRFQPPAP